MDSKIGTVKFSSLWGCLSVFYDFVKKRHLFDWALILTAVAIVICFVGLGIIAYGLTVGRSSFMTGFWIVMSGFIVLFVNIVLLMINECFKKLKHRSDG